MADMETKCLAQIYRRISGDCEWETVDAFMQWSRSCGYHTGMDIRKIRELVPHGPNNSYWYKRQNSVDAVVSRFCDGCKNWTTRCDNGGCADYRQWFVANWNKNICRRPKDDPRSSHYWCYEHPDRSRV